jgi:hypothetical protein
LKGVCGSQWNTTRKRGDGLKLDRIRRHLVLVSGSRSRTRGRAGRVTAGKDLRMSNHLIPPS